MQEPIIVDYFRYPFLVDPVSYVKSRYGRNVSLIDLLSLRGTRTFKRALDRVYGAIKGEVPDPPDNISLEDEVLGYHLSIVLVALTNDKWLADRYAEAEARRVMKLLHKEELKVIVEIAKKLDVNMKVLEEPIRVPKGMYRGRISYEICEIGISVFDYLKVKRLRSDPSWKLTNQLVKNGMVYLSREKTIRFIAELLTERIRSSIVFIREVPEGLKEVINSILNMIDEVRGLRRTIGKEVKIEELGVHPQFFPPCIEKLYDEARRGKSLPHHGRFALATFLLRIGADVDYVVDIFRNMPDFNEQKTRYQVEHLAGEKGSKKKYLTYSCSNMKTLGLCVKECKGKNPLMIYLRNLRRYMRASKTQKRSSHNP